MACFCQPSISFDKQHGSELLLQLLFYYCAISPYLVKRMYKIQALNVLKCHGLTGLEQRKSGRKAQSNKLVGQNEKTTLFTSYTFDFLNDDLSTETRALYEIDTIHQRCRLCFKNLGAIIPENGAIINSLLDGLKGQSHQDLVLLENPMKVLVLLRNPLIVAWPC